MQPDSSIIIAALALAGSIGGGVMSYRASTQANRIDAKKVDAAAYERSQAFYEKLLAEAERALERMRTQVDRLQDQLERVTSQLAQEQDVSQQLRNHLRILQQQFNGMDGAISTLRTQLSRGESIAPPPSSGPDR